MTCGSPYFPIRGIGGRAVFGPTFSPQGDLLDSQKFLDLRICHSGTGALIHCCKNSSSLKTARWRPWEKPETRINFVWHQEMCKRRAGEATQMSWEGQTGSIRMRLDVHSMFQDCNAILKYVLDDIHFVPSKCA